MADRPVIGETYKADLEIARNADTQFSVEWWEDDDHTEPVPVSGAVGAIRDSGLSNAAMLLDLTPYCSAVDNVVVVTVPKAVASALESTDHGQWDFVIESADGLQTRTISGSARIVNGASL